MYAGPRIVSASPEVTELLFQLGKGGDLVATSSFSFYPEAAKQIPTLGPLYTPSIEKTVALKADWALIDEANLSPAYERALGAVRIPSLKVTINSVDELFASVSRLLESIYGEKENAALARAKRCVASVKKRAAPERFLAFVWLSPPTLVGHATFLSDVISRGGDVNVLPPEWKIAYPQLSEEWLMLHPVDSVYFLADVPDARETAAAMTARWWPGRKPKLVALAPEFFARASFTPLRHLGELGLSAGEDCSEKD